MARKKYVKKRKRNRKRGRGIPYIYKNGIYFGKKTSNRDRSSLKSYCASFREHWKRYWYLMVKRKYVLCIKFKRKTHKRNKKK